MNSAWWLLVASVALAGCGSGGMRKFTEADHDRLSVADVNSRNAISRAQQLELEVSELKTQVADLNGQIASLRNLALSTSSVALSTSAAHDSLVDTFNSNVAKDNDAAVRDMTRRGLCGTEWMEYPNGGRVIRNKECTIKDLR